jgi:hypothetical protein
MVGARLVLPGPYLDGENIYQLMHTFKVTVTAGEQLLTSTSGSTRILTNQLLGAGLIKYGSSCTP